MTTRTFLVALAAVLVNTIVGVYAILANVQQVFPLALLIAVPSGAALVLMALDARPCRCAVCR
jgi:hypothetical protein